MGGKTLMRSFLGAAGLAVLLAGGVLLLRSGGPPDCEICARPIHPPTAFSIRFARGEVWACCPRCGLSYLEADGGAPPATATDYPSGRRFAAPDGYYVVGSDLTPCCSPLMIVGPEKLPCGRCYDRCTPSVIAFEKAEEAWRFTTEHGGRVVSFDTLQRERRKP